MVCKEAENLIPQYLDDSMDKDTLLEFMSHIRECRECYHELDTFFMVEKAMETLKKEEDQSFDLSEILYQDLNRRWLMISRHETQQQLTIFYLIIAVICVIWMVLDLYGIISLSYLL
ncbi:MAG: zf-HC2 domain-containing protein [Lachnospiraceae bacterium]|nr:zf-HC2 domain-containing protein [Lachnospiraceae bacterium]